MKYLITLIMTAFFFVLSAQSNIQKAKAYYFQAQEQYEKGNYTKTVDYLNKASELLKGTNGSIEALRVKAYHKTGNFKKAKASLENFYNDYENSASSELQKKMSAYIVKIDDGIEKEKIPRHKYKTELENSIIDINLRSKPHINSKVIYICPKNSDVFVIDNSNKNFHKVYVDGKIGYISSGYLKRKK